MSEPATGALHLQVTVPVTLAIDAIPDGIKTISSTIRFGYEAFKQKVGATGLDAHLDVRQLQVRLAGTADGARTVAVNLPASAFGDLSKVGVVLEDRDYKLSDDGLTVHVSEDRGQSFRELATFQSPAFATHFAMSWKEGRL